MSVSTEKVKRGEMIISHNYIIGDQVLLEELLRGSHIEALVEGNVTPLSAADLAADIQGRLRSGLEAECRSESWIFYIDFIPAIGSPSQYQQAGCRHIPVF